MAIGPILVALVVLCFLVWGVRAIVKAFTIEDPFATLIYVALAFLVLLWFLGVIGGPGSATLRLWR